MTLPLFDVSLVGFESHLAKSDFAVRAASIAEAREFIARHHYAGGSSNTASVVHGMFFGLALVGVAMWMPPTGPCARSVAGDSWRTCLSLSRLAIDPAIPTNGASFLVGKSIRLIRREGRWTHLVTFADESQGHNGAIYRATNWTYAGLTKPTARWVDSNGRQVAIKSTVSRTKSEMEALGHRMVGRFAKHKFTMDLTK